jgi:hypothetical protein
VITVDEAKDLLRRILSENPTRHNPQDSEGTCLYNGPDGDHCIAGAAFIALGKDEHDFQEGMAASDAGAGLGLWERVYGAEFGSVQWLFDAVQQLADGAALSVGNGATIPPNRDTNHHGTVTRLWGDVLMLAQQYDIL